MLVISLLTGLLVAHGGSPSPVITVEPPAVALIGRVTDSAGRPLVEARVTVVEIRRSTTTSSDGTYRVGTLPSGTYSVTFALIGYAPEVRRVSIRDQDVSLDITLRESAIELQPLQITATPGATTALESPQPTSVLGGEDLITAQAPSLGSTIEGLAGVRNFSTGTGIGKPVIRGLTSNRVLILADGQRLETSQWGDEHSPNVETADAERIEIIRGPASVLYGSDALGGVINVIPRDLPEAIDRPGFLGGDVSLGYSTNTKQPEGTVGLEGASGGLGFRGSLSGRTGDDVGTPAGELFNSGNRSLTSSGAVGYRGGWGSFTTNYSHREERIEIHEDPAEDPAATPNQRIGEDRAKASLSLPIGAAARMEASAGYERNRRREFEETDATDVALGLLSKTWSGDVHLHHSPIGRFSGIVGISGLRNSFEKFGEETLIPNSTSYNVGAYLFEQTDAGRWSFSFGARYDRRELKVEADTALGNSAQTRSYNSVTGNLGVLYRVGGPFALVANVGRGYRAPSSFDLFANGVHEGTVAFERGDPALRNETSLNTDVALRIQSRNVGIEVGGFVNYINDFIHTRPTGTFDSASGFQIFDVVQGDARLMGFEAAAEVHPTSYLHLKTSLDLVQGQNTSTDTPLPFIPPFRVTYSAKYEGHREGMFGDPYFMVGGETHSRQTRLDSSDFAPPGYTLISMGGGFNMPIGIRVFRFDLSLFNAFDKKYASFLSRYKTYALNPGRNLVIRLSTTL